MEELITVEEFGPDRLEPIGRRALTPEVGLAGVIGVAERQEASIFAGYAGKYVQTGALRVSLTQAGAAGAIRRLTPTGLEFGSSVWYARFQGTTGVGDHARPSAILKATEAEGAAAALAVRDYVLHGVRL